MNSSPNGIEIDRRQVQELRRQCLHHNVFPIFLPNAFYGQKPKPVYDILSKLVAAVTDQLECLNSLELEGERERIPEPVRMLLGEQSDFSDEEYRQRIAIYQIVWAVDQIYSDFDGAFVPMDASSEVAKMFPELINHLDDDGLLEIGPEFELHDGGVNYRDHVLHYHQCLRRGFASNPNFSFTQKFASYHRKLSSSVRFRIAIDPRRVMHQSQYQQMMEFDTWYGPAFDPERLDDPNFVGLTMLERERPSLFDFSNKLDRTEFYWSMDRSSGIKSFEIEEIASEDIQYSSFRINRYVHSERDTHEGIFRHLDGAVKVYNSIGVYRTRHETKLPKEPRADKKPKLFRLDGVIPMEAWLDLIGMFFKGNEMVLRYFDQEKYEALFRDQIQKYQALISQKG